MKSKYKRVEISINGTGENSEKKAVFAIDEEADLIQKLIFQSGDFYERDLLDFVRRILPKVDTFIDIGGNIGNHSVFFGVACDAEVYAFEPNGPNYQRLVRNLELSGLKERMHTFNMAVGETPGYVTSSLGAGSTNTGGAGVKDAGKDAKGSVPLVRADEELAHLKTKKNSEILLKIDVEGMEVDVLKGSMGLIEARRPVLICEISSDKSLVDVKNMLEGHDYLVFASFFKSATFVLLPIEKAVKYLPLMSEASWRAARSYVEFCRLARVVGLSKGLLQKLNNVFGI